MGFMAKLLDAKGKLKHSLKQDCGHFKTLDRVVIIDYSLE